MSADEQLRQDWEVFGRADGYDSPKEQELRDLADRRNRKRGEETQRARIKRNRQQLAREREAEQRQEEGGTPGPALPAYLLERGEPSAEAVVDEQSSGDESSSRSGDSDEDGKDDRRQERRVNRWSASSAAQDVRCTCGGSGSKMQPRRSAQARPPSGTPSTALSVTHSILRSPRSGQTCTGRSHQAKY